jgi:hypothetical protein
MQEENNICKSDKPMKTEECIELKNIKYKTMLLNGNGNTFKETKMAHDLSSLETFLENEKNNNKNEPWCKLDKTIKTVKLLEYVEQYKTKEELTKEEEKLLIQFLKESLERKKLQRVKDVIYDKITGQIKDIPGLFYTKNTKHFTLKNMEKRISTLKSLTPKKVHNQGTIKNKGSNLIDIEKNDSGSDSDA